MADRELVEALAALEHTQWIDWTKFTVAWMRTQSTNEQVYWTDVRQALAKTADILQNKWERNWKPYEELTEEMKELDRIHARRAADVFTKRLQERLGLG